MYICLHDNEYGQGATVSEAFEDLDHNSTMVLCTDQVRFYELGKEVKVKQKIEIVD